MPLVRPPSFPSHANRSAFAPTLRSQGSKALHHEDLSQKQLHTPMKNKARKAEGPLRSLLRLFQLVTPSFNNHEKTTTTTDHFELLRTLPTSSDLVQQRPTPSNNVQLPSARPHALFDTRGPASLARLVLGSTPFWACLLSLCQSGERTRLMTRQRDRWVGFLHPEKSVQSASLFPTTEKHS